MEAKTNIYRSNLKRVQKSILSGTKHFFTVMAVPSLMIICWQLLCTIGILNTEMLPSPIGILQAGISLILSGTLFLDAFASLRRVFIGFAIAAISGISLGLMLGGMPGLGRYLRPMIELLRPIPPIAWIPISILWFGLGDKPAYFLVALGAFFPIFVNSLAAVNEIDIIHLNAARCLGARKWFLLTDIIIPVTTPSIITGLRVGLGIGWICVITAELVGAQSGLGYMIQLNRMMLQTDNVLVGMITIGLIGITMGKIIELFEKNMIKWKNMDSDKL